MNMTATDKLRELLRALSEKTAEGRLQWEETPNAEAFKALFQSGTLIISREKLYGATASSDAALIRVEVLTPGGRIANHAAATSDAASDQGYDLLFELWNLARTNARRGDQLVDELLREVR